MQALQEQLSSVTKVLQNLSGTDVTTIDDAKSLKSLTFVIDKVLKSLATEICNLEQLKIRTLLKLTNKVAEMRPALESAEKKFMIKYVANPETPLIKNFVSTTVGDYTYQLLLFQRKEDIPIMSYGTIMFKSTPMIIYRYGINDFVSVTDCEILDFTGPNDYYRTICCGNTKSCEYENNCKYFHDPLIWPDSDHVQRFVRTNLVKNNPYFGDKGQSVDQLTFENLRTLARYCAFMMLMIRGVCKHSS